LYYYVGAEMNEEDLEYTRVVVNWTKETLTKLDYNYLDQQEKFQPGCKLLLYLFIYLQKFVSNASIQCITLKWLRYLLN